LDNVSCWLIDNPIGHWAMNMQLLDNRTLAIAT